MIRPLSVAPLALLLSGLGPVVGLSVPFGEAQAYAQSAPGQQTVRPRPKPKRPVKIRIDSSPQQAAVYWDSGVTPSPRDYGIAGYTPIDLKVPKGPVKIVVELRGWKTQERDVDVRKPQAVTFTLERAPQPGKLDLRAGGDGSAAGAEVSIDGVVRGTLPNVFDVFAGHHQIEVKKQGYKPFTEWIDLAEEERRTRDLMLERSELPPGSLLVTSDGGGDVYVDGVRKDVAPAMISALPPGEHIIEVRREGSQPWRQNVTIVSGQQSKVTANLGVAADSIADLKVIATEPDVEVFVDGEDKGHAPLQIKDLHPGAHVIEGRKPRFKVSQQAIKIGGGEQAVVQLKMELSPEDRPKAALRVQSLVPDAEVFLDGSSIGKAPVERHDLDPGKHFVVVRKDGFADYKREVVLVENQPTVFAAELKASGMLRFLSTPRGASVLIDGEPIGATPAQRPEVSAGDHIVEFKMAGYFDSKQTIKVEGGKERVVAADLKALPTGPSPEQVQRRKTGMSTWGAVALPQGAFVADVGTGYPYFFFARMTVGAFNIKSQGLDLGIEFQSFVQMNTLAVHGRLQLAQSGPLAVAMRADLGGGAGSNGKNTLFTDLAAVASLAFADIATFSIDLRFSAWTDQFCPSKEQLDNDVSPDDYCKSANPAADSHNDPFVPKSGYENAFASGNPAGQRFSGSRLYAGLAATFAVDRLISVFLKLDFLPGAGILTFPKPRMAYEDKFNSAILEHDPLYYGTAGVSLKF